MTLHDMESWANNYFTSAKGLERKAPTVLHCISGARRSGVTVEAAQKAVDTLLAGMPSAPALEVSRNMDEGGRGAGWRYPRRPAGAAFLPKCVQLISDVVSFHERLASRNL